jgi:hypothetical protein
MEDTTMEGLSVKKSELLEEPATPQITGVTGVESSGPQPDFASICRAMFGDNHAQVIKNIGAEVLANAKPLDLTKGG